VMGIGMGYAIGAAVVSGKPVVAIEGDSALVTRSNRLDRLNFDPVRPIAPCRLLLMVHAFPRT